MIALAYLVKAIVLPHLHRTSFYGPFIPAVLLASIYGGFGPGVFVIIASLLLDNVSLNNSPNLVTFGAKDPEAAVLYILISLCLAICGGVQRRSALRAIRSAGEARSAHQALTESERVAVKALSELETIYDQSPVGLCLLDADLRFVRINERLAVINELTAADHIGKTLSEVLGKRSDEVVRICKTVLSTGKPLHARDIRMAIEGEERFFLGKYDPVFGEDGTPVGVTVVVEETTEQHRGQTRETVLAEATKLLNSSLDYEDTLRQLCESVVPQFGDWCAIIDLEDGRYRQLAVKHIDPEKVKWAHELHEKYPPEPNAPSGVPAVIRTGKSELVRNITPELIAAADLDAERLAIVNQIGLSSLMVVPISVRDEVFGALTLVWAESKHHYADEDLQIAEEIGRRAGTAIDNARLYLAAQKEIRERIKAEDQIKKLNNELEGRVESRTAELRAAMDELEGFCYSVSHDLRAPMRSLSGNSRMLIEDYGGQLTEDGKEHLRRISLAASKMGELVDDLLQFSRLGRAHLMFRAVNLSDIAEASVTAYKSQNPESNALVVIQPDLIACGDPNVLALAIQNLFDNALKYSSKVPSPRVEFGVQTKGEERIYYIKDNGVGFDMKYAPKIFEPFQRLHRDAEYPGTGIGLANVKRVIARHGGHIWVEAAPGHGATLYFTLCARCNEESMPTTTAAPPYLG